MLTEFLLDRLAAQILYFDKYLLLDHILLLITNVLIFGAKDSGEFLIILILTTSHAMARLSACTMIYWSHSIDYWIFH